MSQIHELQVFRTVVHEGSFSRAAEKLFRTQPAISLAVQRLEAELGEKLLDRSGRELQLTDTGRIVLEYAERFHNLRGRLDAALAELRDKTAGTLAIGANESTGLYLLRHIERFRARYPGVRVQIRRFLSSRIPDALLEGELEMGVVSYDPEDERLASLTLSTDTLVFIVSPRHRFVGRDEIEIAELGDESFIAHNVGSPYRELVLRTFRRNRVPLKIAVELPAIEAIRKLVQADQGVAFLPRMCVEQELESGSLHAVLVREINVERKIRLLHVAKRPLGYASRSFLELVGTGMR
jgi:DNA-binding transcriptional LysR family regulator